MKFLTALFFLSIFFMSLSADNQVSQILITKTSKESNLRIIKHRLDSIRIKMYLKKSNSMYFVYSQRYRDIQDAKDALKNIRRYFKSARITTKKRENSEQKIDSSKPKITENIEMQKSPTIFIGIAGGSSSISEKTTDESASNLDNSSLSFLIEGGYIFNENIFVSLAYLNSSTSDLDSSHIYLSANYQLNATKNLGFYFGLMGGYSILELKGFENSQASNSMLFGGQIGSSYKLFKSMAIYVAYKALSVEHSIELSDSSSAIEFNLIHSVQLGVNYRF